jgi:hypothetical protein
MGGFMLYENGVMTETLSIERLEELESEGRIHWPKISEKEIEDRSKGDVFSKAFTLLQTMWFITQCTARWVYGLVITELEVTTLAFAALNGILYFFWWDKPLGVACPVPVYLIPSKREAGTQSTDSDCEENTDPLPSILSESSHTPRSSRSFENEELSHLSLSVTKEMESTPLERISFPLFQQPCKAFVRCCVKPLFIFYDFFENAMENMETCTTIHGSPALSVPIFYAPSCGTKTLTRETRSLFIGGMTGILFGGTHCIASAFPSVEEKYLWRASAATITAVPIVFFSTVYIPRIFIWISQSGGRRVDSILQLIDSPICFGCSISELTQNVSVWVYLVSRIVLLILPLIALRSLPPGSLVDIKWSSFIPHI